jgi:dienelactone hydrolase
VTALQHYLAEEIASDHVDGARRPGPRYHTDAAVDAWRRMLDWFARHLS